MGKVEHLFKSTIVFRVCKRFVTSISIPKNLVILLNNSESSNHEVKQILILQGSTILQVISEQGQ